MFGLLASDSRGGVGQLGLESSRFCGVLGLIWVCASFGCLGLELCDFGGFAYTVSTLDLLVCFCACFAVLVGRCLGFVEFCEILGRMALYFGVF